MALITGGKKDKKPNPYIGELKDRWSSMPPRTKQRVGVVGLLIGVLGIGWVLLAVSGNTGRTERGEVRDGRITNMLLPTENAREIGVSSLAATVDDLRTESQRTAEALKRGEELRASQEGDSLRGGQLRGREAQVMQQIDSLKKEIQELREQAGRQAVAPASQAPVEVQEVEVSGSAAPAGYGGIRRIETPAPPKEEQESTERGDRGRTTDSSLRQQDMENVAQMYMPSGAIVTGVLITGLDAPTGRGAVRDPIPVLVRVKKEAILPNHFRADIKECFLLAAGHGDLASERAYLRSETISCVRHDKAIIDMKIQAYAVDADGKAGMRGRLVSKQGAALGKAIIASFAEGVSRAFSGNNRVSASDGYNSEIYGQGMEAGAVGGVSSALDRISKYYLDLADAMHPVLEIDAGRPITFVFVKGEEMPTVR